MYSLNSVINSNAKVVIGKKEHRISVKEIFGFLILLTLTTLFVFKWVQPPTYADWKHVVVKQGDTLWNIATTNCPTVKDRQDELQTISVKNDLNDEQVYPGQVIFVPTQQNK